MTVSDVLRKAGVTPDVQSGDAVISGIASDSRQVVPGSLFVCTPGHNADSHSFIPQAIEAGAVAVLTHSREGFEAADRLAPSAVLVANDGLRFNEALWRICDAFFDHPTRNMKVIGVTGTNGKTTVAWLLRDMLAALGLRAAYLGTLGFQLPGESRELSNTTPFAVEYYNLLDEARQKGVAALAMEVSSHALAERRIDGTEFDAAVFTNLTQDHLDFHGSMEAYEVAKLRLFTELPKHTDKKFVAAVNIDDPVGERWASELLRGFDREQQTDQPLIEYGLHGPGLSAHADDVRIDSIRLTIGVRQQQSALISIPLGGSYNVENCMGASAGMLALGFGLDSLEYALPLVRPVPGRFEAVPNDKGIGVLVDYAHTPDALEKLLDAVRPLTKARVITVFGCGGDRDRNKRPKMAKAASERSNITVVTSDNPRTEEPQAILDEVLTGIVPGRCSYDIIDRREAIDHAVKIAEPGDVVVIAGKGHENYQIVGHTKYPMDDRLMAQEALEAR